MLSQGRLNPGSKTCSSHQVFVKYFATMSMELKKKKEEEEERKIKVPVLQNLRLWLGTEDQHTWE